MHRYQRYYDFKLGQINLGYFTIVRKPGHIMMMAKFETDGEVTENLFELKLDDHHVTAFKIGGGEWQNMDQYGKNHYPTSAYPLLLPRVKELFVYHSIDESTGEVEGERMLERVGDVITESLAGKITRVFQMKDGIPVEINWGGPISTLRDSLKDAKAGSPFA
jgi:hypothetical protein